MTFRLSIIQQATETPMNLSSSATDITGGFADSSGLLPMITLVIVLLTLFVGLLSSARFYRYVLNASGRFAASIEYAIKGVATAAVMAVFGAPFYLVATMDAGTRSMLGRGLAVVVVGYVGLVALGYVGERVWSRVVSQHEAATGRHPLDRFRGEESEVAD